VLTTAPRSSGRAADAYIAAMNSANWRRVARSFSDGGVRIPPNEEPHQGREAIERWLGGIEELSSYELIRDRIDGADGIAYVRGRYAITLRPVGAPAPLSGAWDIIEAMWNTRLPASAGRRSLLLRATSGHAVPQEGGSGGLSRTTDIGRVGLCGADLWRIRTWGDGGR